MERYLIDTSMVLDASYYLENLQGIVITSYLLDELELKYHRSGSEKTKRVLQYLMGREDVEIDSSKLRKTNTVIEGFIGYALETGLTYVTCDIARAMKAKSRGVKTLTIDDVLEEQYTGVKTIFIDTHNEEDMAVFSSHKDNKDDNIYNLQVNQYLIIYDKHDSFVNERDEVIFKKLDKIGKWSVSGFRYLIKNERRKLQALNDLQLCALDLLYDKDIPIKVIAGNFGSGKTYLSLNSAIDMVLGKRYKHIMCVRNPIGDTDSEDIGFLPGDKAEKIEGFYRCITNNLSKDYSLEELTKSKKLSYEIPYYMKGMSISDTFILVEEAEDLTLKTLKLIGSRVSTGSTVCFSGDYKQTEGRYINNSGLLQLINRTRGESLVGCVVLDEDVRSSASKIFANL